MGRGHRTAHDHAARRFGSGTAGLFALEEGEAAASARGIRRGLGCPRSPARPSPLWASCWATGPPRGPRACGAGSSCWARRPSSACSLRRFRRASRSPRLPERLERPDSRPRGARRRLGGAVSGALLAPRRGSLHSRTSSRLALGWSSPPGSDDAAPPRAWAPSEHRPTPQGPKERGARMTSLTEQQLEIPEQLKPADGRFGCGPSKVRPAALARLASDGAAVMGTSHRQKPVKALVRSDPGRAGRAVLAPRRLRGRARQRWRDGLLGCGRLRADQGALASPDLRRVLAEVRLGQRRRTLPRRADPRHGRPGAAPDPAGVGGQASDGGADLIAWAHNETSTGVMVPVVRPAGAGEALVAIDATSGAGGLPVDVSETDVYYFAPAEGLRLRRRPVDRAAQPGSAGADRRPRLDRSAGSPSSSR